MNVTTYMNPNITAGDKYLLTELFNKYHLKTYTFKKAFQKMRAGKISLHVFSLVFSTIGVIFGGITLNPLILGLLTGGGIVFNASTYAVNIDQKTEALKVAYQTYRKCCDKIAHHMRTGFSPNFTKNNLIDHLDQMDDFVTSNAPIPKTNRKKYYGGSADF